MAKNPNEPPKLTREQRKILNQELEIIKTDMVRNATHPREIDYQDHPDIQIRDLEVEDPKVFDADNLTPIKTQEMKKPDVPVAPEARTFLGSLALGKLVNRLFKNNSRESNDR